MVTSILPIEVNVLIEVVDVETNAIIQTIERHNLVVTTGRNLVRDRLSGDSASRLTHFAVGTNATAVVAANTALGVETSRDLITQLTPTDGVLTVKYFLGSSSANGVTLAEAGLFNAASAGTMFSRVVYTGIVKTSSVAVSYTWTISIGAT